MINEVFHIRNFEQEWGERPGDMLAFVRRGTLSAGDIEVDLSKEVRKGAEISYLVLNTGNTHATTGKITASNDVGDTADVMVMIFISARDLAPSEQLLGG